MEMMSGKGGDIPGMPGMGGMGGGGGGFPGLGGEGIPGYVDLGARDYLTPLGPAS